MRKEPNNTQRYEKSNWFGYLCKRVKYNVNNQERRINNDKTNVKRIKIKLRMNEKHQDFIQTDACEVRSC